MIHRLLITLSLLFFANTAWSQVSILDRAHYIFKGMYLQHTSQVGAEPNYKVVSHGKWDGYNIVTIFTPLESPGLKCVFALSQDSEITYCGESSFSFGVKKDLLVKIVGVYMCGNDSWGFATTQEAYACGDVRYSLKISDKVGTVEFKQ